MKSRFFLLISTLLAGFALSASKAADSFVTPRTGYTQPDLVGLWNFSSDTPRQRSPQYGENTVDYPFPIKDLPAFEGKISALSPIIKVGGLVHKYGCHEGVW